MSSPHEPARPQAARCAAGRRRPGSTRRRGRSHQRRQPRDACPQRQRLLDSDHEAFVEWFVAYWRRHGSDLFSDQPDAEEARIEA